MNFIGYRPGKENKEPDQDTNIIPGDGTELSPFRRSTGGGVGALTSPTRAYIELRVELSPKLAKNMWYQICIVIKTLTIEDKR